jgi:hypothetical protein
MVARKCLVVAAALGRVDPVLDKHGKRTMLAWVVFFRTGMPTWNFLKTTPFAVRMVRTGR